MTRAVLSLMLVAVCLAATRALAQVAVPPAHSRLAAGDKFRIYFRQTYSLPSVLFPAAFAGLDQATDSPKEWGRGGRGYLDRLATQRGQFQIGAFCGFAVGGALHEDPRFFPSGRHGMWRRTGYVLAHTLMARTDGGRDMPAFGNYAAALGAGFAPASWLPASEASAASSLERSAAMLGMNVGMNMGIEFGSDDRRFFHDKILRRFRRRKQATDQLP